MGLLSEGWRCQVGAIAYAYSSEGSFDQPQPAGAERLTSLLAQAKRQRDMCVKPELGHISSLSGYAGL